MKNRLLAIFLLITMMIPVFGQTLVFAEDTEPSVPVWTANGSGVAVTAGENGYHTVSGLEYATTAYKTEKVRLDGLTIEMKVSGFGASQAAGIIFSSAAGATYGSGTAVAMTLWHDPYANGQSRLHIGASHDYNEASFACTDEACTNAGFGVASSMVLNSITDGDLKIEITSHSETAYKVKLTIAQDNLLWGINANYADETGGGHSCTVYIAKSHFADALDSNGKLYVSASGLSSPNYSLKVTESAVTEPDTPTGGEDPDTPDTPVVPSTEPTIVGKADGSWIVYSGAPASKFAKDGYTEISNLTAWGARAYYSTPVKFDGLEISLRATTNTGDCVGLVFAKENGAYFGDKGSFGITYWNALYEGQARLVIAESHSYQLPAIVHVAPDLESELACGIASSVVCNQAETMGWTIKFESYNDEFYSVKITMTDGTMWENNANYNAEEKSCTVYLPKTTVAPLLNEKGECYIISAGFPSGANPACSEEIKVVDDNYTTYINSDAVTGAQTKVQAYKTAAEAITDATSYDAAMTARAEAVESIKSLRAREVAELELIISGVDAKIAENDEIVEIIKKAVTDKIDAAKAAYDELIADPAEKLTQESLNAAKKLREDAKSEYEARKSMLSDSVKTEIETALDGLVYQHDLSIALLWVVDYQKQIEALDATKPTIVNDLVEVKAYREGYTSSTAYTKVNTVLSETDKAAVEASIATCDAAVVNIETVVLPQLKESYVKAMEDKLKADLTVKPNLDDAKTAYNNIATYVTITEDDGELYTRYVAGYNTLKTACETYVRKQIADVTKLLETKYTKLDDFTPVRTAFKSIKLDYLMEENTEIATELATLETVIEKNVFYLVTATNIPNVEWNDRGLAVESKVEYPARLNYNKPLSLRSGVEVVIELTSAAYYNDGTSANNLCFNLLASPNSYKGYSDGITVMIWLFPTECNVQIFNYDDVPLASSAIATPMDGGTITISAKYQEYYSFVEDATYWAYVIKVNEAEIVLTQETLTNNGHSITDEVYFSMGSFADDKTNPNILTLVSVNDVEFGMTSDEPVQPDQPDEPDQPTDPDEPDQPTEPDDGDSNEEEELSFIQQLARFFRGIFDAIKNFFAGIFNKS